MLLDARGNSVIDRRAFIGTAAVGALMLSSRPHAQRAEKLPRVALVFNNIPVAEMTDHRFARAFVDGMRDLGLVEGRNIAIERRSAEGRYERLPSLMQELLALQVDVIVAIGPSVGAARRATDRIPIVAVGTDGFVEGGGAVSLARPGRNLTGLSGEVGVAVNGKRLQLLTEVVPKASRVAFLGERSRPSLYWRPATEAAAHALGLTLLWVGVDTPEQFNAAFAAIAKHRADSLFVDGTPVNYVHARPISEFAARLLLPAVYTFREGPEAGG
jgi:putative ABC transport system substrate-binding protein